MAGAIGRRVNSRYGMEGLPWETRWRHIDPTDETKGTETLISPEVDLQDHPRPVGLGGPTRLGAGWVLVAAKRRQTRPIRYCP